MVFAVNGDDTFVETLTNAHEMNIRLNRVSGCVRVNWQWYEASEYLLLGAFRSFGKHYSHHELFTADCDLMHQRLFWRAWGLSCSAFGSCIDERLDKQVLIR